MRVEIEAHLDYAFAEPADVLLQIEAAALPDQQLEAQALTIWSDHPIRAVAGEDGIGQRTWARGEGRLIASYAATVTIARAPAPLERLAPTAPRDLPAATIPYLLPSRYCPSDRFEPFVRRRFAGLAGGPLAAAIVDWVSTRLEYASGASSGDTDALQTLAARQGVCRDYAHLVVAMARAAEIPARCVSAYAPGVDPPDFHAVAELWLDGAWHLADATGMGDGTDLVRVAVGRDATDIAFMTVFGEATLLSQRVAVRRIAEGTAPPA